MLDVVRTRADCRLARFQTYFPHVDNIYSHRSTQKYKRKPFVSHYWDCRLKGRPPGTAKSEDPNKKKRKRQARERDLCDVKIKITEYFPGAKISDQSNAPGADANPFVEPSSATNDHPPPPPAIILGSNDGIRKTNDVVPQGTRYYTIQRVNGNGANGKDLASPGGHKHSLIESDKIKKNSIVRFYVKEEKEKRKSQVCLCQCYSGFVLVMQRFQAASCFLDVMIAVLSLRHDGKIESFLAKIHFHTHSNILVNLHHPHQDHQPFKEV